ncbi:MAG TPA: SPOR domain-containing protein [Bacteroidia bacterium]|jgi:hypothetical protein|nr:SPOR domain-containing protein [Bacteroidia bacterium]
MQKIDKVFFYLVVMLSLLAGKNASAVSITSNGLPSKDSAKQAKLVKNEEPSDNGTEQQLVIHPIIRLGVGMLSYVGNVKANAATTNIQSPASGRVGYDLGLSQKLSPVTEFSLEFLYGNLAETQYTTAANWNFQSTIAGGGINFLFKLLPKQEVTPFVLIGVESYEFLSRANIYDQNGNQFFNWSDGTLRSTPQTASNAAYAKILNLNYDYSTDVRSLNLDGSGKYSQQTFAIPVGVGFMFRVGTRADFMVGTTLHYTFTDHIDGLTPQVSGPLKGTLSNDMFAFSYVSLRFNLTRDHPKTHRYDYVDNIDMTDTVHPYGPGTFDTSEAALQMQYEREMDTTGKYAKQQIDPFSWKVKNAIAVTNPPSNNSKPAPGLKPANGSNANAAAHNTNNSNTPGVYKIQLLATYVPLAEGITFAGINDKASVTVSNGLYKYTTGNFTDLGEAQKYLNQLRAIGYTDAFITGTGGGNPAASNNAAAVANGTPKQGSAAAIAQAVGTGLVYKIQLGVFGSVAPDQHFMSTLNQFQDMKVVKDNAGLSHYLVGSYTSYKDATDAMNKAKAGGIKDVCVMAFNNGHYISNAQAQSMEKK